MKKALKYTGVCSLLLAVVAFILMLATPAIVNEAYGVQSVVKGGVAIFGSSEDLGFGFSAVTKAAPMGLLAWILALAGLVIVLLGVLLPLLKVRALEKFAGVLNLVAVGCFVVAGVFMFIVVPSFYGANGSDVPSTAAIGAGWVIGAIIYMVAGAIAILPAAADFLGKKKRK